VQLRALLLSGVTIPRGMALMRPGANPCWKQGPFGRL